MPSLERTTKTLSNAATPPSLFTIPVPFQQCGFLIGWGQGTELQYWALLPGKPKSGRASCLSARNPNHWVFLWSKLHRQVLWITDWMVISVAIQEPMTWREVRLCSGLKIWFFSSWLKQILTLKVFFLEEHRWNILGALCEHLAMKYLWVWGLGITFPLHHSLGLCFENRWLLMQCARHFVLWVLFSLL